MMKTSKCRPKEVFEFFSEAIFLRTSSDDFDEIMMVKCGFKFNRCSRNRSIMQSSMHDEGKFSKCRNVEQIF